ncbi:hypothetical protein NBRC116494_10280 [Aurantivibrio plasticivorans]
MAVDEEDEGGGEGAELKKLQKSAKTTRTLFFSVLVTLLVIVSILITSVVVINIQLSKRNEVPSEEFAEQLATLNSQLEHISVLHNSEARVYFDFQDTLDEVKALYTTEEINLLRQQMMSQEQDRRKMLDIMASGHESIAAMMPGNRRWVEDFKKTAAAAKKRSLDREKAIKESMTPREPDEEGAEDVSADKSAKK